MWVLSANTVQHHRKPFANSILSLVSVLPLAAKVPVKLVRSDAVNNNCFHAASQCKAAGEEQRTPFLPIHFKRKLSEQLHTRHRPCKLLINT